MFFYTSFTSIEDIYTELKQIWRKMSNHSDTEPGVFYREYKLHHYKQRFNWDCGLSCVLMILDETDRNNFVSTFDAICQDEGFQQSTWTIDLCYLLRKFGIEHKFYTITLGVHPGYKGQHYYEEIINRDEERVNERFENALSNNISVEQDSLSHNTLLKHLQTAGPIILLVDANVLTCDLCKYNKLHLELKSCLPWPRPYLGHYIVICGYNLKKNKILYRNPSFRDRLCAISYHGLEKARKSYGTDEDIILIYKQIELDE